MSRDRCREVSRLYHAAMAQPADARVAFLTDACPDDSVRQEVQALLAQPLSAPGFLEPAAFGTAALALGDAPTLTGSIGPYEVKGLLGAGGMGEVYRARDTTLGRDVAQGPAGAIRGRSRRLARFEREAQLLAALNHPNIAAIYGLEETRRHVARARARARRGRDAGRRARARVRCRSHEALDDRAPDRRRARGRAREGHRSSRSQAREHQDHARRRRQGARLRSGEGDRRTDVPGDVADAPTITAHDAAGIDPRHARPT